MLSQQQKRRLIFFNGFMSFFHLMFALVTSGMGNIELKIPVYDTSLTFSPATNTSGFDLLPTYEQSGIMELTKLAALFFLLSALAHLGNGFIWTNFYFTYLDKAQSPTRWIEYFFSASVMMLSIAYTSGIRGFTELHCIFWLVATTILFGWLQEVINRPKPDKDEWQMNLLSRSQAHVLGYIPQLAAWYSVLYTFLASASGGCGGPPDFVYYIVLGEAVLFFSFGAPQLYQILSPPSKYVYGEYMYQFLSLLSKGVLGIILLVNVLMYDRFEDAVIDDNVTSFENRTNCTQ